MRKLIYDIETMLLKMYGFQLGKQVLRHNQLVAGHREYHIICISYMFLDDMEPKCIRWNPKKDPTNEKLIEEFDAIVRQADVIIGKNNTRFDDKHVNTQRMLADLDPLPYWAKITDDVETQLRRYFYMPSQSLDYWSEVLGLGGKDKMEFSDWVYIKEYFDILRWRAAGADVKSINIISKQEFKKSRVTVERLGKVALDKMVKYNIKDVTDTAAILQKVEPYVKFKHTQGDNNRRCKWCKTETKEHKNGTYTSSGKEYQMFYCSTCRRYKYSCLIGKAKYGEKRY